MLKTYRVNFHSTNAEVEAENEQEAIEKFKILYYDGGLPREVEEAITLDFKTRPGVKEKLEATEMGSIT